MDFPHMFTFEGQAQRVEVEDGRRVRYFHQGVFGIEPMPNYRWEQFDWVEVTTFAHPPNVRVFVQVERPPLFPVR